MKLLIAAILTGLMLGWAYGEDAGASEAPVQAEDGSWIENPSQYYGPAPCRFVDMSKLTEESVEPTRETLFGLGWFSLRGDSGEYIYSPQCYGGSVTNKAELEEIRQLRKEVDSLRQDMEVLRLDVEQLMVMADALVDAAVSLTDWIGGE